MTAAASVLFGLLPALVAGSGQPSRLQLDVELLAHFGYPADASAVSPPAAVPVPALSALSARATIFLHRVLDDATPIDLQPFLQRTGHVSVRVLGGLLDGDRAIGAQVDADADFYAAPFLAFTARVAAAASSHPALLATALPAARVAAGIAVHVSALRFDFSYRYAPAPMLTTLPDRLALRNGGAFATTMRTVLIERIDLRVELAVSFRADLITYVAADYHPSRRLALTWSLHLARGNFAASPVTTPPSPGLNLSEPLETIFGACFGLLVYVTPRTALGVSFTPSWHFLDSPPTTTAEERLALTFTTRL